LKNWFFMIKKLIEMAHKFSNCFTGVLLGKIQWSKKFISLANRWRHLSVRNVGTPNG
jgi:hypothetical protein